MEMKATFKIFGKVHNTNFVDIFSFENCEVIPLAWIVNLMLT